jgi:hypothetical protein
LEFDNCEIGSFAAELVSPLPEEVHLLKIVGIEALCRRAISRRSTQGRLKGSTLVLRTLVAIAEKKKAA